jgi:hypothetical protein
MKKEEYKSLIDDCLESECESGHWCLLKEMVVACMKFDSRTLIQFKTVEIYKWNLNKNTKDDIDWEKAWNKWASDGHAELFAKVYIDHPNKSPKQLYKIMFKES